MEDDLTSEICDEFFCALLEMQILKNTISESMARFLLFKGTVKRNSSDYKTALECLDASLKMDDGNVMTWLVMATVQAYLKDDEHAMGSLLMANALDSAVLTDCVFREGNKKYFPVEFLERIKRIRSGYDTETEND